MSRFLRYLEIIIFDDLGIESSAMNSRDIHGSTLEYQFLPILAILQEKMSFLNFPALCQTLPKKISRLGQSL